MVSALNPADPIPLTIIDPSVVQVDPNQLKIHRPALNSYQYGILMPNGKIKAFQYFMKKKDGNFLNVDVERYLEYLAYVHEYVEWGNGGPPGGFTIYESSKPNGNLPMWTGRKKRSVESEEKTTASWPEKIHKMVERVRRGDQSLEAMVEDVAGLYEKEVRPAGFPLDRVVREIKKFFELERVRREVMEPDAQGELVTIFDTDAEAKYLQFLLHTNRKKKEAEEKDGHRAKKDTRPFVQAVGQYIFVPKDTDVHILQEEYRKAIKEQRLNKRRQDPTPQ